MKRNKKILLFPLFILIVIVIISILGTLFKKQDDYPSDFDKVKYVDDIVQNVFYDKNVTMKTLQDTMKSVMVTDLTFIGKDSTMRHVPKNGIIKKYKLEKYVSVQSSYADKVEDIAIRNIQYRVEQTTDDVVEYRIKPWYAYNYNDDLINLTELIMKDAGFEGNPNNVSQEEYGVNEIKARTVAIRILDSYLEDYNNKNDEVLTFKFYFKDNQPADSQLLSFYLNLEGVTSKYSKLKMSEEQLEQEKEKLVNYLNEAAEKGIYDKNNPYGL